MPERAIEELDKITDAGPLEGPTKLMHGIASETSRAISLRRSPSWKRLPALCRSQSAALHGENLVDAYRAVGSMELAEMAEKLGGERRIPAQDRSCRSRT
jgi:hypothetical protein